MRKLSPIVVFTFLPFILISQTFFEQTYGGNFDEYAHSVKQTDDDGFILCGYTTSMGNGLEDVYVVKTDASGNLEWEKTYGGSNNDHGYYITHTNDGGYIFCGETFSYGLMKAFVIRINSVGDTIWTKFYPGYYTARARHILPTTDNGFIICGGTASTEIGETDVFIFKIDEAGIMQWSKTYGGTDYDNAFAMCNTNDDGYLFVGSTSSFGVQNFDLYILKTNSEGDTLWTKTYGGPGYDGGFSVHKLEDNNFVIGVETSNFGASNLNMVVVKINDDGEIIWSSPVGVDIIHRGPFLSLTSDNCIAGCGWNHTYNPTTTDMVIFKMDTEGELLWTQIYGGSDYDLGLSIVETSDLGLAVAGATQSFGSGMFDMYLVKTNSNGGLTSTHNFQEESSEIQIYPNPCSKVVNVKSKDEISHIEFINTSGKQYILSLKKRNESLQFDISVLPKGLYLVKIDYLNTSSYEKIIIN